jgi:hypothetical protein
MADGSKDILIGLNQDNTAIAALLAEGSLVPPPRRAAASAKASPSTPPNAASPWSGARC